MLRSQHQGCWRCEGSQCGRSGGAQWRRPVQARSSASNEASLRRYEPDQVRRDYLNRSSAVVPPLRRRLNHIAARATCVCGDHHARLCCWMTPATITTSPHHLQCHAGPASAVEHHRGRGRQQPVRSRLAGGAQRRYQLARLSVRLPGR
ncbi:hypothetical protein XCR_3650 [Xanthomonas campestris pv. raphani 756C]|nr:hypothetical protein XCR_3650 [Xanthomonas campestris pv. raphani 756C]